MTTKNRYAKCAKISEAKIRLLIRCFAHDLEAKTVAALIGLNRNTINRYLTLIRKRIAQFCEQQSPYQNKILLEEPFSAGDISKNSREHENFKSISVFGIHKRDGKVYTEIVPDCTKSTLQAILRGQMDLDDPGNANHTERWRSYDSLVDLGYTKHCRVNCSAGPTEHGKSHNDCIESFLAFAKSRLIKFHGIAGSTFYLHLKECEFRFNYHDKDLYKMLLKMFRENPLF